MQLLRTVPLLSRAAITSVFLDEQITIVSYLYCVTVPFEHLKHDLKSKPRCISLPFAAQHDHLSFSRGDPTLSVSPT